jgi:hypothetical protein
MTNEELDRARVKEAQRLFLDGGDESPTILIAARLAREGWTPPVAVDPDLAEAKAVWGNFISSNADRKTSVDLALNALKRGRELERKAKSRLIMTTIGKGVTVEHYADGTSKAVQPGMVWKKCDGSDVCPVAPLNLVLVKYANSQIVSGEARNRDWRNVTHYAIITQPEEK